MMVLTKLDRIIELLEIIAEQTKPGQAKFFGTSITPLDCYCNATAEQYDNYQLPEQYRQEGVI